MNTITTKDENGGMNNKQTSGDDSRRVSRLGDT
jgi:hypothetical protein